jgi:hypothetical protein
MHLKFDTKLPNIFNLHMFVCIFPCHKYVGWDIACNMQGPGFEPWYIHLCTLKGEILAAKLLDPNK